MHQSSFVRKQFFDRLLYLSRKLPNGSLREYLESRLRGLPSGDKVGCRAERINLIAQNMASCDDYLEVGVQFGLTLAAVSVQNKTGVDPRFMFNTRFADGLTLHQTTSDEFFANLPEECQYDLVFLDGLHTFEQTARDFVHSVRHLKPNGVIVIDDVLPSSEAKALPDRELSQRLVREETGQLDCEWFGDVWKLPAALIKGFRKEFDVLTVGYGPCGQAVCIPKGGASAVKLEQILAIDVGDFSRYFHAKTPTDLNHCGSNSELIEIMGRFGGV